MKPTRLLLLCGGKSAEHAISLISGWNFCNSVKDSDRFELQLITISKEGKWHLQNIENFLTQRPHPDEIHFGSSEQPVHIIPGGGNASSFFLPNETSYLPVVDVVFPLLHGPNGEDGRMQGLLELLQVPYVGPGVLSSAICMDKVYAKQLMQFHNIPTSNFLSFSRQDNCSFSEVKKILGLPLFVKPANMGSSVGVSKVSDEKEFKEAIGEAFQYDSKIIIEEFVEGIEVECAVLGNDAPLVSPPGTYIHHDDFFDFDTKYKKNNEVSMQIPAESLSKQQQDEVMQLSVQAYEALDCNGLARVDTFFTTDGRFLVNEINTLPGFTQNSMYPILWEKQGIAYLDLIEKLCALALG